MKHQIHPRATAVFSILLTCLTGVAHAMHYNVALAFDMSQPYFADSAVAINDAQRVLTFSDPIGPSYSYKICVSGNCNSAPIPGGGGYVVNDISNFGDVAGTVWDHIAFAGTNLIGYDRGSCSGCGSTLDSESKGINSFGQATGWAQFTSGGPHQAFFYTSGSGMISLGTLGGVSSEGRSINEWGEVAGNVTFANSTTHAFRYHPGGSAIDLGTLGGPSSLAFGINDSGRVVGCAQDLNLRLWGYFRDASSSAMQALPALPASTGPSCALAVNNLNVEVRYSTNSSGYKQAVRFQRNPNNNNLQVQNLNNLLNPGNPQNPYWTLLEATGINNSGVIVGTGIYQGFSRAFVLTPVP